jgi:hypothetical protein
MEQFVTEALDDAEGAYWALYENAFQELRSQAVQRHLMFRSEFEELLADKRVPKYVVRDEETGRIAALSTMTNDLAAVPLISPEYFERNWPELYAAQQIWYVGFVAVDPEYQGSPAMGGLVEKLCADVDAAGGLVVLDICEHRSRRLLAAGIERLAGTHLPGLKRTRLDAQVFWGYEFPDTKSA